MRQLIIDNIGPISHVELDLKRVNILMGPQSAGKSCILKIACFCAWAEKRIELEQGKNGFADFSYIQNNLVDFHKLNGFLRKGSRICYKTEHIEFVCDFDKKSFDLSWNEAGRWTYKRPRVSYIPAERNLIAVVPNWLDVRIGNSNILSFISDWNLTRQLYKKSGAMPVLGLGVSYYFDEEAKTDNILLETGKSIEFSNASSGLQSVVPMWVYLNYLFDLQYGSNSFSSVSKEAENEEVLQHIYTVKFKEGLSDRIGDHLPFIGRIGMSKLTFASEGEFQECKALVESYTKNVYADIYLEEPELNLFPQTQVELIYQLMEKSAVHDDGLFVSSHSPYILYALNNCMLGYKVREKMPSDDRELFSHEKSWINPDDVGVWELQPSADGSVALNLQDEEGLIRNNYFDSVMKTVMNDFTNYSIYYD